MAIGIRVNQLAKEIGVDSKAILAKCREQGLGDKVPNHMTVLSTGLAEAVRDWFNDGRDVPDQVQTDAPAKVESGPDTYSSSAALLVDGSALFFGQRAASPDKNLDYHVLVEMMQGHRDDIWPAKPAMFFTAADEANEKQTKFNQMIHSQFQWTVRQVPPHEAVVINPLLTDSPSRNIRFDALIAYSLARIAGRHDVSRVFIISDSWPLAACVKDCIGRGTPVTVCFFGDFIDTRWHKEFRDFNPDRLDFLDLQREPRLFNRPRRTFRREDDVLDLP